jgi:hypothetical protein
MGKAEIIIPYKTINDLLKANSIVYEISKIPHEPTILEAARLLSLDNEIDLIAKEYPDQIKMIGESRFYLMDYELDYELYNELRDDNLAMASEEIIIQRNKTGLSDEQLKKVCLSLTYTFILFHNKPLTKPGENFNIGYTSEEYKINSNITLQPKNLRHKLMVSKLRTLQVSESNLRIL